MTLNQAEEQARLCSLLDSSKDYYLVEEKGNFLVMLIEAVDNIDVTMREIWIHGVYQQGEQNLI